MFFFVNYKEIDGRVTEIHACVVEGDHEGPDQIFQGPDAVEQLRAWAAQHPYVDGFSTRISWIPPKWKRSGEF